MAELKNIRIAVSGIYDYAKEELPTLRVPLPGQGAPGWVEDKRIYKVYRPASVLAAACGKFANLPLTHHHPNAPVDGQNFRDFAMGWTGERPEVDYIGETNEVGIRSTCVLCDDEALRAYGNGEIQLSPGYVAKFEWQQGKAPDGQEYDIIMREITDVNHVALLPAGRGGEYAVVMDGATDRQSVFDIVRETEAKDAGPESVFDIARKRAGASVFDLVRMTLDERRKYKPGDRASWKDGIYEKQPNGTWHKVSEKTGADFVTPHSKGNRNRYMRLLVEAKKTQDPENAWRVDTNSHKQIDYKNDRLCTTPNGSVAAVTPDGDIISVCVHKKDQGKGTGSKLLKEAVKAGGKKLDSFDGNYRFYVKNGFEPVSWCEFDEQYAPPGWRKGVDRAENVIFFKYTGNKVDFSKEEFYNKVRKSADYDAAQKARDAEV